MKATHLWVEELTQRQRTNKLLKALSNICDADNGTLKKPYELASMIIDGEQLIKKYHRGDNIYYHDGYIIIEADESCIYVDISSKAMEEWNIDEREIETNYKIKSPKMGLLLIKKGIKAPTPRPNDSMF